MECATHSILLRGAVEAVGMHIWLIQKIVVAIRWTTECDVLSRRVKYKFVDPGGMEDLIGLGGNLSEQPGIG